MREIKFRAWDKDNEVWYHQPFTLREAMALQWVHKNPLATFAFMQFTGLHDAKGTEIYEGDILSQRYPGAWEVVYEAPKFILRRHDNPVDDSFLKSMKRVEIIGNIYENPELIGEKTLEANNK